MVSLGILDGVLFLVVNGISIDGLVIVGYVYDGGVVCFFCWM